MNPPRGKLRGMGSLLWFTADHEVHKTSVDITEPRQTRLASRMGNVTVVCGSTGSETYQLFFIV